MASPPSLSAAPAWLELFDSSKYGLGLRVTRDAPAGTALLMERPLVSAVATSNRSRPRPRRRCRRCLSLLSLRAPSRVQTCRGCRSVSSASYCDSDCEEEDRDAHISSGECELLRRVGEQQGEGTPKTTAPFLREACLSLRLLRARPPSAGPLVTHADELLGENGSGRRRQREMRAVAEMAARALEATLESTVSAKAVAEEESGNGGYKPSPPQQRIPYETILRAVSASLCAVLVNCLELRFCDEDEVVDVGTFSEERKVKDEDDDDHDDHDDGIVESDLPIAVYAFAARANHSCRPSASFSTRSKGRISLRALRDLRRGEEVTISYLGGVEADGGARMMPLASRRRVLQETRCFRCECERCCLEETLETKEVEEDAEMSEGQAKDSAAAAAAAAALSSLLAPCLTAERLLARGETAAIEFGGKAWSFAARALVEAAGEALREQQKGGRSGNEGKTTAAVAAAEAEAEAATTTTTAAPPLRDTAGPPPHPKLFSSLRSAVVESGMDGSTPLERAPDSALLGEIPTAAAAATAARAEAEEGEEDEKQRGELEALLRGSLDDDGEGGATAAFALAQAAAHASARAAALLGAALGRSHPFAERARFLAFGGGGGGGGKSEDDTNHAVSAAAPALPFEVAANVARLSAFLEKNVK